MLPGVDVSGRRGRRGPQGQGAGGGRLHATGRVSSGKPDTQTQSRAGRLRRGLALPLVPPRGAALGVGVRLQNDVPLVCTAGSLPESSSAGSAFPLLRVFRDRSELAHFRTSLISMPSFRAERSRVQGVHPGA